MPPIGKRMIKTSIAVFLCFGISLLRRGMGIPFYSVIAAILCMQPSVADSKKTGIDRGIGTLIGGVAGVLFLLTEPQLVPQDWLLLHYFIVSLCIIPLIYSTVLLGKPAISYITCVVFLSITISHGGDHNPMLFAANRMLDTLIGIFVSLLINAADFKIRKV